MNRGSPGTGVPAVGVRIVTATLGPMREALPLNPAFLPEATRLRLQLEIDWAPSRPVHELAALESRLSRFVPSLREHACRGDEAYRLGAANDRDAAGKKIPGFDPAAGLAHLIEHVMIDVVANVTVARRVSGVTGVPQDPHQPIDLFVECPDEAVARLAMHVALSWTRALLDGGAPAVERSAPEVLRLARDMYRIRPRALAVDLSAFDTKRYHVEDALKLLREAGFACAVDYAMNFSGVAYYRVAT